MLIKLQSSLQTKNYLGLNDATIETAIKDPYYNYLRLGGADLSIEKSGQVLTLIGDEMNIHKDYVAIVQPNPVLHEIGIVSYNPLLSGLTTPSFVLKAHKKIDIELDWLYEIRLMK